MTKFGWAAAILVVLNASFTHDAIGARESESKPLPQPVEAAIKEQCGGLTGHVRHECVYSAVARARARSEPRVN